MSPFRLSAYPRLRSLPLPLSRLPSYLSLIHILEKHLLSCRKAIEEGVQLIGYCPWSAIDLVSTGEGCSKRYGFVYVNRDEFDLSLIHISRRLEMQRSNVSSILNELVKEGAIEKTDGRPVLYRIPSVSAAGTEKSCFSELIGNAGSLKGAVQLAKAAILYPGYSLPVLITGPEGSDVYKRQASCSAAYRRPAVFSCSRSENR